MASSEQQLYFRRSNTHTWKRRAGSQLGHRYGNEQPIRSPAYSQIHLTRWLPLCLPLHSNTPRRSRPSLCSCALEPPSGGRGYCMRPQEVDTRSQHLQTRLPTCVFQIWTHLSKEPLARWRPSGLNATLYTGSWCLVSVWMQIPRSTSHRRTVESNDALQTDTHTHTAG